VHIAKRITLAAVCAVAAIGLTAGAASASASSHSSGHGWPTPGITAATRINNAGTVPGYSGDWASSTVTRVATLHGGQAVAPSNCGLSSGNCYAYTATVTDSGQFHAFKGALTPNQVHPGTHIKSSVNGSVTGSTNFGTFYSPVLAKASLVPSWYVNGFYTTDWPLFFFPYGTDVVGLDASPWSFSYYSFSVCGIQRWTDSSTNDFGDLAKDGNITGCHRW
jgi:hypothetical protein